MTVAEKLRHQVDPSNWLLGPADRSSGSGAMGDHQLGDGGGGAWHENVKWRSLLNVLFWNLNYFDSASAFSGDCVNPSKTFPRGQGVGSAFPAALFF